MVTILQSAASMGGITIRWREGPFTCELERTTSGGVLRLFENDELVANDTVQSVFLAYQRARELSQALLWKRAKGA